jgi:hypothetical protein
MMSTEHPYESGSPQVGLLLFSQPDPTDESSMSGFSKTCRRPMPIVIMFLGFSSPGLFVVLTHVVMARHRPMYSSDADEQSEHWPGAAFQVEIEPLFHQFGVDVYVCGHMHMSVLPDWI